MLITPPDTMVISYLANIVQGGGEMFYLGFWYSTIRQKAVKCLISFVTGCSLTIQYESRTEKCTAWTEFDKYKCAYWPFVAARISVLLLTIQLTNYLSFMASLFKRKTLNLDPIIGQMPKTTWANSNVCEPFCPYS